MTFTPGQARDYLNTRGTLSGATGFSPQQAQAFLQGRNTQAQDDRGIFEGNFFSDIIDAVQVPMYAVGGAIQAAKSGSNPITGAWTGIKETIAPSEALGINNPWAAFVVDVAFDPFTYVMPLGLTRAGKLAKAGKGDDVLKTTLSAQFRSGQRSFLTLDVPFSKSLKGQSIIQGNALANMATKSMERAKHFTRNTTFDIGSFIEKHGGRGALDIPSSAFKQGDTGLDLIEKRASLLQRTIEEKKNVGRQADFLRSKFEETSGPVFDEFNQVVKQTDLATEEAMDLYFKKIHDDAVEIPSALQENFNKWKAHVESDKLNRVFADEMGKARLEGKKLPTVKLEDEGLLGTGFRLARENEEGFIRTGLQTPKKAVMGPGGKVLDPTGLSDEFAGYTGFKGGGEVLPGYGTQKGATVIKGGEELPLTRMKDTKYYVTESVLEEANKFIKFKTADDVAEEFFKNTGVKLSDEQVTALKGEINFDKFDDLEAFLEARHKDALYTRIEVLPEVKQYVSKRLHDRDLELSKNIYKLTKEKELRVANKVARENFIEGLKSKELGLSREVGKEGLLPGEAFSTLPGLKGYAFPSEAIRHIDATYIKYGSSKEISSFLAGYDKVLNLWKATATFWNMAFHSRNVVSNFWQLHLADVPQSYWGDGFKWQWMMKRNLEKGVDAMAGFPKDMKKYLSEYYEQGLGMRGVFKKDIVGVVPKLMNTKFMQLPSRVGGFLEDGAKISAYLAFRKSNKFKYSPAVAAKEVRKYLYDYGDLTDFEKNTWKRFFPFYTWTRNNIPLQVSMLIQKPTKVSNMDKFVNSVEQWAGGGEIPEQYMPEWLREAYPVYLGRSDEGLANYIKFEGYIPSVDLNMLSRPLEIPFEQMSPIFKTPLELISNHSFFFEKQIKEFEGQKSKFLGVYLDPKTEYALSQIRPLSELNKAFALGDKEEYPDAKGRFWNWFIGKSYDLDLKEQKQLFEYVKQFTASDIKKEMDKAFNKGDMDEYKRLKQLKREVERGEGLSL